MGEETSKKINEELSEEKVKDVAGGRRLLLRSRCEYCGRSFEADSRTFSGKIICPECESHLGAARRTL